MSTNVGVFFVWFEDMVMIALQILACAVGVE
jgi:hypothetical protein